VTARRGWLRDYGWGLLAVAASGALSGLFARYLRLDDLIMIHLLGVVIASTRFSLGASLFTAAMTALSFDYFFIPPAFELQPPDLESAITLTVMIAVAGVISVLGEQTRRQQAVARARDLQMETERLRNSLLSAVSHDLKTPLASILGAGSELLRDGARLDPGLRDELARGIVEEAERLEQLVTNLLDAARLEGGRAEVHKRPEPLDEVIEAAMTRLRGRLGARPVHTIVPEEVPMVPMDAVLVRQVFVNLFENAVRYTPEGSALDIEVTSDGSNVAVEFRDRGPGIGSDEGEQLFERFHRGQARKAGDGGAGLGLTICRAIIQAHGGTIAIANRGRDGEGTLVRFTLPLRLAAEGTP
jgi:K+-sensing histidine kinase KdpD